MKEEFMPTAISWAEKKGFSNIRANFDGYDQPKTWKQATKDREFVPDISGTRRGKKNFVELALKTDNIKKQVSKWKLLSLLAARRGGKLILLAPRGHKAHTVSTVKDYNLSAEVVSLSM